MLMMSMYSSLCCCFRWKWPSSEWEREKFIYILNAWLNWNWCRENAVRTETFAIKVKDEIWGSPTKLYWICTWQKKARKKSRNITTSLRMESEFSLAHINPNYWEIFIEGFIDGVRLCSAVLGLIDCCVMSFTMKFEQPAFISWCYIFIIAVSMVPIQPGKPINSQTCW